MLVVSESFPPAGDPEAYVGNLAGRLARAHGWRVVVVTRGEHLSGIQREEDNGLVVHRLPSHRRLSNSHFGLASRRHIARLVRIERPDLVNAHLPSTDLARLVCAATRGVPLVVTCHSGRTPTGRSVRDALASFYRGAPSQQLLRRAEWIISTSDFVRDFNLTRFRTKCSTVTPGVAVTWAARAAATDSVFGAVLAGTPVGGKRRISVVAPRFPPQVGGLEQYAYQIARGLQESGRYEVQVLTSNHAGRRIFAEVLDGLTVLRYPAWVRASNTPMSPTWPYHLRRTMRDNRIELVNVHTPVPFMAESAALACGARPLAVTYHAGSMVKHRQPADTFIRAYERLVLPHLLGRADAVIAVSELVRSRFLRGRWDPVDLAPPAVDTDLFRPAAAANRPTLLYVGRIERSSAWKGIDVLLRAFVSVTREVPDAQLVLVGGGDALPDHRRDVVRLGLAGLVTFSGVLTGNQLAEAYASATAIVLPSTTEAESFGMCLIEGMACAKPVIGSDVGGIPFVIDDGEDGLLVPPGDADALAACSIRVLRDPKLAATLGASGRRKVVESYTWQSRVAQYDRLFRELLDGSVPLNLDPPIDLS